MLDSSPENHDGKQNEIASAFFNSQWPDFVEYWTLVGTLTSSTQA